MGKSQDAKKEVKKKPVKTAKEKKVEKLEKKKSYDWLNFSILESPVRTIYLWDFFILFYFN